MFKNVWNDQQPGRSRIDLSAYTRAEGLLTASEQMYFFGAPLAHVQRYELELEAERNRRAPFSSRAQRHYCARSFSMASAAAF